MTATQRGMDVRVCRPYSAIVQPLLPLSMLVETKLAMCPGATGISGLIWAVRHKTVGELRRGEDRVLGVLPSDCY